MNAGRFAPFDLGFLEAELARLDLALDGVWVIDTLEIARRFFSFPSNRLDSLRLHLGLCGPAHRALADVRATFEVFWTLLNRLPNEVELLSDLQGMGILSRYA